MVLLLGDYCRVNKILAISVVVLFIAVLPRISLATELVDTDQDGITDNDEVSIYHTDPTKADTDNDGFIDGEEIKNKYSPIVEKLQLRQVDTDKDGVWDDWEVALGTDLLSTDTDYDGFTDGEELKNGYDLKSESKNKIIKKIETNLASQSLKYFFGSVKLDEFKISGGLNNTPTPIGEFSVITKRPVVWYKGLGYNYPNTKWNLMFKRGAGLNYYIHGAYWHNDFGKPKSHGCINVAHNYEYMGRLYDWAEEGTSVIIN